MKGSLVQTENLNKNNDRENYVKKKRKNKFRVKLYLKVLTDHSNWEERLGSFDP